MKIGVEQYMHKVMLVSCQLASWTKILYLAPSILVPKARLAGTVPEAKKAGT